MPTALLINGAEARKPQASAQLNSLLFDFGTEQGFLGARTPDGVLAAFHLTQQHIGLRKLASFSEHDVVRNPDAPGTVWCLRKHLNRHTMDVSRSASSSSQSRATCAGYPCVKSASASWILTAVRRYGSTHYPAASKSQPSSAAERAA